MQSALQSQLQDPKSALLTGFVSDQIVQGLSAQIQVRALPASRPVGPLKRKDKAFVPPESRRAVCPAGNTGNGKRAFVVVDTRMT